MNPKKYLSILLFTLVCAPHGYSQQIFRVSQYLQHNFMFNPAAAGVSKDGTVGLMYKKMWSGMEGGPQTALAYGDYFFEKMNTGAAIVLYNDVTGPTSRSGFDLNAAYAIRFDGDRKLHIGLNAILLQERIDKMQLQEYIPNDPLLAGPGSIITADAGAGVYYASNTFSGGFSVKQLVQSKLNLKKTNTVPEGRLYRHYFLTANYNWKTDEDNVIIPSMMVRFTQNTPATIEVGAILKHKDIFWTGFGWQYKQSFTAYAGVNIKKRYSIGYAFDEYATPLSMFDGGSGAHEIMVRYSLK